MQTCPSCNGPMKLLFNSFYCPRDCDKGGGPKLEGTRTFIWKGERWRVTKAHTAAAGVRNWHVGEDECDFMNWSQDQIEVYARAQVDSDDCWDENGPGRVVHYDREAHANSTIWIFTKECT